jgi:hypothetical protein
MASVLHIGKTTAGENSLDPSKGKRYPVRFERQLAARRNG